MVVNQPVVRDRSVPGSRSCSRPWPSQSMRTWLVPVQVARAVDVRHDLGHVGSVIEVPVDPSPEPVQPVQQLLVEDGDREEWDQAHHRTHPDRDGCAVRSAQDIVVEAVLLIPQALMVHCQRDHRVVLEKLDRDVLIDTVVRGQRQRQLEH